MSGQYDAPNQQVVRPDGSGPWEEGSGGSRVTDGRRRRSKGDDAEKTSKRDDAVEEQATAES